MSTPDAAPSTQSDPNWSRRVIVSLVLLGSLLLLAAPNLLALGIVLGVGSGAHAGDRTLDVEAPAFRGGTLAGALLAIACVATALHLLASRRRALRQVDRASAESEVA